MTWTVPSGCSRHNGNVLPFQDAASGSTGDWNRTMRLGRNVASYKFALGRAMLEQAAQQQTFVSQHDLAVPYATRTCEHLEAEDRQGMSAASGPSPSAGRLRPPAVVPQPPLSLYKKRPRQPSISPHVRSASSALIVAASALGLLSSRAHDCEPAAPYRTEPTQPRRALAQVTDQLVTGNIRTRTFSWRAAEKESSCRWIC